MIYLFKLLYLLSVVLLLSNVFDYCRCEHFFSSMGGSGLGFAYEFKIHVDPGKEECFYQEIDAHTNLYVAFQVVKGGDGKAGFGIRDPYGTVVMPYAWKDSAEYELDLVPAQGVYQFCIDNSLSRFNAKLISFYCSCHKRDEWEKLVDDLKGTDENMANITTSLSNVDKHIGSMLKSVDQSRRHKQHDYLLLESNYNYVHNLSITQCVIMIAVSVGQVFFLRKMFNDSGTSSIYKPSA